MVMTLEELQELWGRPLGPGAATAVTGVCTDSRRVRAGDLFIPLVGETFDGHGFLEGVLAPAAGREGAAAALAQRDRLNPDAALALARQADRPLWLVDDTLRAYQDLARWWRRRLGCPVVAVTGSAGKTTTRELIRAALAPLGPVVASSGNENNDIGAPLTLLKARQATAAVVVEMGMRGLGEIGRLSRCAQPDVAVITNIGTAHIGRLGSREAIATAKCEIAEALSPKGLLVIPAADPLLEAALAGAWGGRVERVALADEAPGLPGGPQASWIGRLVEGGQALRLECWPGTARLVGLEANPLLALPLAGRHNARNLLLALAVAVELGVPLEALAQLEVEVPGGRNRRLRIGQVSVLDETYNASPEAVMAALQLLAECEGGRRWAVLGTMLELGEQSLELHRQVARRARELDLDGLVVVAPGPEGEAMEEGARGMARLARVATPEAAAAPLLAWVAPGDVVLLKGSRGVALESLLPLLQEGLGGG
ncbi:MAG: UDP-N-acetylmuramoyl-tripeptide--D-alanyl-D-alanine ligase [Cyanobacteriota bacterium]|nr:UDP-N-acetylmuramoyl-tripeptide--D-alanyl-D-alanine ligase [Cyanobacteriota bacterium]